MAASLLACEDFAGRLDDSFPSCAFLSNGDHLAHTSKARVSPQWLSERRQLWPGVSRRVACELIFPDAVIGSHTVPGQHSQPTPTSLGQGCVHV